MDTSNQVFSERCYQMDPEFEDLLYGSDLKDGMLVLIQDPLIKGDPTQDNSNDYDKHKLLETNRWCEVTQFKIQSRGADSPLITFIGVYSDGTKFPRTYDASYCWFVKKPGSIKWEL